MEAFTLIHVAISLAGIRVTCFGGKKMIKTRELD